MKYDVFVSYSRKDTKIVDEFVNRLEAEGIRVWIDRDGIESGDAFKRVIVNAIKESALFMFFSSESSNNSPWTTKEVSIAVHYDKPIIPIKIDRTIYNADIEFDLVNLDYIDYTEESLRQPMMDKLVRTIKSKLSCREENVVTDTEVKPQTEARECAPVAPKSVSLEENTPAKKEGKKGKKALWIMLGIVAAVALAVIIPVMLLSPKEQDTPVMVDKDLTIIANGVDFVMKPVQGGSFKMGSAEGEADDDERAVHSVELKSFYLGEVEVTQALWKAVMEEEPTYNGGWEEKYGKGGDYPAYRVSWASIQGFIRKLNKLTGKNFRLPTEAEWEYAAKGGKHSSGKKYAGSDNISNVAWYQGNSGSKAHVVKTKMPNELGLYDMSGNVWEWCQDWYGDYNKNSQTNPQGPSSGTGHVLRGGSWYNNAGDCRVSNRYVKDDDFAYYSRGFRLALSI